jgi:phospholipid/cholesterol/gamma-HCH transport system permease protein
MKMLDDVGRGTIGVFTYAGGAAELLADSVGFIASARVRVRETLDQAYLLGVQSWTIVLLTSLFTGMVFSLESAVQAVQYGVGNLVGGAVAFSSARELGPMLSAVVVAGRTGAAIAAELGSMVVTEQIEALQALGLSPVRMLVVPRLVALVIMLPHGSRISTRTSRTNRSSRRRAACSPSATCSKGCSNRSSSPRSSR